MFANGSAAEFANDLPATDQLTQEVQNMSLNPSPDVPFAPDNEDNDLDLENKVNRDFDDDPPSSSHLSSHSRSRSHSRSGTHSHYHSRSRSRSHSSLQSSLRSYSRSRSRHRRRYYSQRSGLGPRNLQSRRAQDTDDHDMDTLLRERKTIKDRDVYIKIMRTKLARACFQLAWWFIISQSDRKADFVNHLIALGFTIPQWVDWSMPSNKGPFPTQWGHLPITLAAVSFMFQCYTYYYRDRQLLVAQLAVDEGNFLKAVNQAKVNLFDRRSIAQGIIYAIEKWEANPVLTKNFKKGLNDDAFKKVGLSHYRIDNIPSNQFSSAKGCIAPSIFRTIYTSKKKVLEKQVLNQSHFSSRNNNNSSNYGNNKNRYGSRYNNNRYGSNQRGYYGKRNYNTKSTNAAQKDTTIKPNPLAASAKTTYGQFAPSGTRYPDDVTMPTSDKNLPIYAPKLGYFNCHFIYPEPPANMKFTDDDVIRSLAKVPYLYCADYQSGTCEHPACNFHHLCEWCGSPHIGNSCAYRPKLRKRSAKKSDS